MPPTASPTTITDLPVPAGMHTLRPTADTHHRHGSPTHTPPGIQDSRMGPREAYTQIENTFPKEHALFKKIFVKTKTLIAKIQVIPTAFIKNTRALNPSPKYPLPRQFNIVAIKDMVNRYRHGLDFFPDSSIKNCRGSVRRRRPDGCPEYLIPYVSDFISSLH